MIDTKILIEKKNNQIKPIFQELITNAVAWEYRTIGIWGLKLKRDYLKNWLLSNAF